MEMKKWEDMNGDCLVNIFGRVGMESLIFDVPFVCKSWFKATLNPLCWQSLIFPQAPSDSVLRVTGLLNLDSSLVAERLSKVVRGAVKRSQRSATRLALFDSCDREELLVYVSEQCALLRFLSLPYYTIGDSTVTSIMSKLTKLEELHLQTHRDFEEIIVQISLHCKNFVALTVTAPIIYTSSATAIATRLPNIERLALRNSLILRSNVLMILEGCKRLVHFDISYCNGFGSDDKEILNLGSNITTYLCMDSLALSLFCYGDVFEQQDHLDDDFYYSSD